MKMLCETQVRIDGTDLQYDVLDEWGNWWIIAVGNQPMLVAKKRCEHLTDGELVMENPV